MSKFERFLTLLLLSATLVTTWIGVRSVSVSDRADSPAAPEAQAGAASPDPLLATRPAIGGIKVAGNRLETTAGDPVYLHGVDRTGTEFACVGSSGTDGFGIFSGLNGLNDDQVLNAMTTWTGVNSVFYGFNEDCLLAVNGVNSSYAGTNYLNALVRAVHVAESYGMYPVIGYFWGAPGSTPALDQPTMPDDDHAPAAWELIAKTFKNDPDVIFRLQEEPHPAANTNTTAAWNCWSQGDVQYSTSSVTPPYTAAPTPSSSTSHCSEAFSTVGMQSLINIIRGVGAHNVIQVPGVQFANSLTHFLDSGIKVTDTLSPSQLMADIDVYPEINNCGADGIHGPPCTIADYDRTYAPVARVMPVDAGEMGPQGSTSKTMEFIRWMDAHGSNYYAWAWSTGVSPPLLSSYAPATPTVWGLDYRRHLAGVHAPPPRRPNNGILVRHVVSVSTGTPSAWCSNTFTITGRVEAGDLLIGVFGGLGFNAAATRVSGVSDSVNGAWTQVYNSGSQGITVPGSAGTYFASFAVYRFTSSTSAPSGLTVTTTTVDGATAPTSGVILDLGHVSAIDATALPSNPPVYPATGDQIPGTPYFWNYSPTSSSTIPSGDLVLALSGGYSHGQDYVDQPPDWNLMGSSAACGQSGAAWNIPTSTATMKAQIAAGGPEVYEAALIALHP